MSSSKIILKTTRIIVIILAFQLIPLWPANKETKSFSIVLYNVAIYRGNGDFLKAKISLNDIENSSVQFLSFGQKNDLYDQLGTVNWILGNPSGAVEYFLKMKINAEEASNKDYGSLSETLNKIVRLYFIGKEYRNKGKQLESISAFKEAIRLSRFLGRPEYEMKCLRQMSVIYLERSRLSEFLRCNEIALKLAREIHCRKDEGFCLNNIGLYYYKMDNYSKSLEYYYKSLLIARSINLPIAESECLTNIGIVYKDIGKYEKSLEVLSEAIKIDKLIDNNEYIGIDFSNIGAVYRRKWLETDSQDDLAQALLYLNESYKLLRADIDTSAKIKSANNLGTISNDLGDYPQAIQYFRQGLMSAQKAGDQEGICLIENNLGITHSRMGNDEEALACFRKAIELAANSGTNRVLGEAFLETAEIQKKKGAYEDALKSYQYAIDVIEKNRAAIEDENLKTSYWRSERKLDTFHGAIDLLDRMNRGLPSFRGEDLAFQYMERAKARGFLDRLEISRIIAVRRTDPRMDERTREIQTNLSRLFRTWFCEPVSAEKKTALEREIWKQEDAYEDLRAEARARDPIYSGLRFPKIVTIPDLSRRILDGETVIFTYSVGKDTAYGLAITRKNRRLFRLPPPATLRELIGRHLKSVSDREGFAAGTGVELYQALLAPGFDRPYRRVIVVPDDVLYYVPFESLRRSPASSWLGTETDISYAPSVSSLAEIDKRAGQRESNPMELLAVAAGGPSRSGKMPPAPYSEKEADDICRLYRREKCLVLKGTNASEEAVKAIRLEDFRVIHFAAHGLIDEQRPIRSSIVLSSDPDSSEDGLFQVREIFETHLNASLVVLSACRSAAGGLVRGEGLEGLNRSFLFAGASAVLTSLWPVDDEATAYLMSRFYIHLREGDSIAGALRRAKTEMIGSAEYSHPAYWAGFIVTGLGDQRPYARRSGWIFAAGAGAFILATILWRIGIRLRAGRSKNRPAP
jgi:CHAT domain-containing protein/Tfp pilus assembly protein PilF